MADNFDKTREEGKAADLAATSQFLTFTVAGEEYGVDIMTVREIKGWTETTRLPNSPDYMRGVMNLRGLIIPIFDLRARFSRKVTDANSSHVVIILAVGDRNIGVLVDGVSDILTVSTADIKSPPELDGKVSTDFIAGLISLQNRMVVLLSIDKLFGQETLQTAEPAIHAA